MNAKKNELTEYIRLLQPAFVAVAVISLFVNLLMLTMPLYMVQVFDRVISSQSTATLIYLTIAAGGALLTSSCLDMLRGSVMVEVGKTLDKRISVEVFSKIFEVKEPYNGIGARYLRDLAQLRQFIASPVVFSILDIPWIPIYLSAIFILHPVLGFIALGGAVILVVIGVINHAWTHQLLESGNKKWAHGLRIAEITERKVEVTDAMGFLQAMKERWEVDNHEALRIHAVVGNRISMMSSASKLVRQFLQILILGVGAYFVIGYELSSGAMLASSILLSRGLQPIEQCIGSFKNIVTAIETYRRLFNFMSTTSARETELQLPTPEGKLDIVNVSYAPPGSSKLILKNVSFGLIPGEMLVLVGPSGSGKSTLASLLMGIWKPQNGIICLDNANVYTWNRTHFGQNVGYLPQEIGLFPGSVAENIARMTTLKDQNSNSNHEDHTDRDITVAAKVAGAHEMILGLTNGYQTQVGENGCYLSGGQRQRIGLARALFVRPKVLVLDEPDAYLDLMGQKCLWNALKAIKKYGVTIVLISHQQCYMEIADKILLLKNGGVEKFAAPDQFFPRQVRDNPHNVSSQPSVPVTLNKKEG